MGNPSMRKTSYWLSAIPFLVLMFLTMVAPQRAAAQTVCVPRLPPASTVTIDGQRSSDWDTFSFLEIDYDGSGNYTTLIAADADYLYFYTEVETSLGSPQAQTFFIGIGATKMLQLRPYLSSDTAPLDDNNIASIVTQILASGWTAWTDPAPPNTDFRRVLATAPERWILEGRITLTHIDISDADNFDLFLHINTGSQQQYWPGQGVGFVDIADPSSLTFGENRCPALEFSEPYLNFGKVPLSTSQNLSVTLSNGGATGSSLEIQSAGLDASLPGAAHFTSLSVTRDSDSSPPPFTLATSETATAEVQYQPSSGSTISAPHQTEINIVSNDPDDDPANLPVQGNGRQYIDTLFILDQSGSMTHEDKWETTEWATDIAFEVLRLFALSQDQVGAVWFGGTSASPDAGVLTGSTALDLFPGAPTNFSANFSQDAQSNFYTPIGYGIEEAHNEFSASADRTPIGLLMSDGLHNRPSDTKDATTVAQLNLPSAVEDNTKSMHIHTVALGTDASVSTVLLEAIRNHYQPLTVTTAPATTYNITEQPENLAELFIEPLMEPMVVNRVAFDAALDGFPVEQNAHRVLAMVIWNRGITPADIQVEVFDETGTTLQDTYTSSTAGYYKGASTDQPYTYLLMEEPDELTENRVWKVQDSSGNPITPASGLPLVLIDLNIIASFSAEQVAEGTGNVYILKAKLAEAGRPITHTAAHPVEVTVRLAKPGEGFGELVSTISLDDCKPHGPVLPPPAQLDVRSRTSIAAGGKIAAPPQAAAGTVVAATTSDPQAYRFDWAQAYLERCNRDGLLRLEDTGLQLHDDGSHGDEIADDGVYTLNYTDTEYEGTYVVRFTVKGVSPTDARFARTRTLSSYVRVDVDPAATSADSRIYTRFEETTVREYYLIPRDRFKRHLGPGHHGVVQFKLADGSGTFASDVIDYQNGIYAVLVSYPSGQPAPAVTPIVQGKPITLMKPIESAEKPPFPIPWWLCLLVIGVLLVVVLGLLVYLWRLRRGG